MGCIYILRTDMRYVQYFQNFNMLLEPKTRNDQDRKAKNAHNILCKFTIKIAIVVKIVAFKWWFFKMVL